jgi:hypothetical protein
MTTVIAIYPSDCFGAGRIGNIRHMSMTGTARRSATAAGKV